MLFLGAHRQFSRLCWFLVIGFTSLVSAVSWYVTKPQRDAERFLRVLRRIQVNQTSTQDLDKLIRTIGPSGVELSCYPDLELLSRRIPPVGLPLPPTPDKPFELVFPRQQYECSYGFTVTNVALYRLHLSPPTEAIFSITTDSKRVVEMRFHTDISFGSMTESDPFGYWAFIDVDESVPSKTGRCKKPICEQRINVTPPGCPDGVLIEISPSAQLSERNRYLALNTGCFSKFGGCRSARELLPSESMAGFY
jgi:hypothetical protein